MDLEKVKLFCDEVVNSKLEPLENDYNPRIDFGNNYESNILYELKKKYKDQILKTGIYNNLQNGDFIFLGEHIDVKVSVYNDPLISFMMVNNVTSHYEYDAIVSFDRDFTKYEIISAKLLKEQLYNIKNVDKLDKLLNNFYTEYETRFGSSPKGLRNNTPLKIHRYYSEYTLDYNFERGYGFIYDHKNSFGYNKAILLEG